MAAVAEAASEARKEGSMTAATRWVVGAAAAVESRMTKRGAMVVATTEVATAAVMARATRAVVG